MKKTLILITIFLSISANAQKGTFKANLVTGLNLAVPVGPDVKQDRADMKKKDKEYSAKAGGSYSGSINPRLGFHLGGTVDYFINNKIAIVSGLIFSQRGYTTKIESKYNDTGIWDTPYININNKTTTVKLNYFDLPISGKYYITENLFLNAGLVCSFLLSDKYHKKNEYTSYTYVNAQDVIENKTEESSGSASAKSRLMGFQIGGAITKGKVGILFNISKTGQPLTALGISYGYPNLLLQCGLIYNIYSKNK